MYKTTFLGVKEAEIAKTQVHTFSETPCTTIQLPVNSLQNCVQALAGKKLLASLRLLQNTGIKFLGFRESFLIHQRSTVRTAPF